MTIAPKVSVVISLYNYGRFLHETVDSVLAQTFGDIEVIVVNDGSVDDSLAIAREIEAKYELVKVLQKPNGGATTARYLGMVESRGEYICLLDADDKIHPEFLEKTVSALDSNLDTDIAYTDYIYFGDASHKWNQHEFSIEGLLWGCIISSCALIRRSSWVNAVGMGFKPNYNKAIGGEDWDFWIAMIASGCTAMRVPGYLFFYRAHPDRGSFWRDMNHTQYMHLRYPGMYPKTVIDDDLSFVRAHHPEWLASGSWIQPMYGGDEWLG